MSSQVEVTVAGVDVTNHAIYNRMSFDAQQNGRPGTIQMTLRDLDRTLGPFITGSEIIINLDGIRLFGGYVTQVSRAFAMPADELPTDTRLWVLRGVDYNILFDKRVTRNLSNLLRSLPLNYGNQYDGERISDFCDNYLDLPAGLDFTTEVDDIRRLEDLPGALYTPTTTWTWKEQGTVWRTQMEMVAEWSGGLWYIDPSMKLHHHAVEDSLAPFGFSDTPDGVTTIGYRDASATEDASFMVNDAFVWGGSEWTEGAVYSRSTNEDSVDDHKLWQTAEHHFGEDAYKGDTQWRSDLIVEGSEELRSAGFNPGLAYPQWNITLTWFGERLPVGADHIRAGQLVEIDMTTFGAELSPITLPMRSVRVDFAGVDDTGNGHVKFTGSFGLQLSDPFTIWDYLLRKNRQTPTVLVAAATNDTPDATYGSFGQFEPTSLGGGVYTLPNSFAYVAGTTQVYVDGVLQQRDTDYTESDPVAGEITFTGGDPSGWVWVVCRTA